MLRPAGLILPPGYAEGGPANTRHTVPFANLARVPGVALESLQHLAAAVGHWPLGEVSAPVAICADARARFRPRAFHQERQHQPERDYCGKHRDLLHRPYSSLRNCDYRSGPYPYRRPHRRGCQIAWTRRIRSVSMSSCSGVSVGASNETLVA